MGSAPPARCSRSGSRTPSRSASSPASRSWRGWASGSWPACRGSVCRHRGCRRRVCRRPTRQRWSSARWNGSSTGPTGAGSGCRCALRVDSHGCHGGLDGPLGELLRCSCRLRRLSSTTRGEGAWVAAVGWDGRDVSGLTHEQIHRWTRDGASPEALAAARDRHLARADELRTAADRLRSAQRGVAEGWVGRDADAAGGRTHVLAARMEELAGTVSGQARGVDGMRAALLRVQAVVGPPRPPVLPGLGASPPLGELRALITGAPADGFAGFRAAADEQAVAREAYRTYLTETAAAARGVAGAGARPPPA